MADLWTKLRPLGETAEHEAEERGRRYIEQRAAAAVKKPTGKPIGNLQVKDGITVQETAA